jgi:hypothetical protein
MAVRVKMPFGILSYPNFKEPRKVGDATKATYSCVILYDGETDLSELEDACAAVAAEKWGEQRAAKMIEKNALKWPIKNGDEYAAKKDGNEIYEGKVFINVKSEEQPGMVGPHAGPDGRPVAYDADQFYPGCWVRVSVAVYAYDHPQGGKGVGLGLNNVQFVKPGPRLDNRKSAADDFDVIETEADEDAIDLLS